MGGDAVTGSGRTFDSAQVTAAFAAAEVHPLLCAVAHVTGDLSLLREEFEPDQTQLLTPGRGLGPEQEAEARRRAAAALEAHVEAGRRGHELSREELRRLYGFLIGGHSIDHWEHFL